jgi:hypothetical protein
MVTNFEANRRIMVLVWEVIDAASVVKSYSKIKEIKNKAFIRANFNRLIF